MQREKGEKVRCTVTKALCMTVYLLKIKHMVKYQ